jgi:2,3-bisphosphoglycerate-independent phosphoglycerate mutase
MDRDNRWDRTGRAYRAIVHGEAAMRTPDPEQAIRMSYERGITDEFVEPIVVTADPGAAAPPVGCVRDGDAVIFFNFRADRARQMTRALAEPDFDEFHAPSAGGGTKRVDGRLKNLFLVAMTQYDKSFPWLRYVFAPEKLEHILAQVFAEIGFKNLRVAETEKYAHVTYFFNGGIEKPFPGEERVLVPSPKVPTYDLQPEMSAVGITDTADMVGHSGKLAPTIKAIETVDTCLGRIFQTLRPHGGAWIITSDHGNAETMIDPATGGPHTYHTTNPVPFLLMCENGRIRLKDGGSLRDVAPTLLGIAGFPKPPEMTGQDLRIVPPG